jgi:hypothetical protein
MPRQVYYYKSKRTSAATKQLIPAISTMKTGIKTLAFALLLFAAVAVQDGEAKLVFINIIFVNLWIERNY